jgi:uncharacterized tellurite resistance protein B-like protein
MQRSTTLDIVTKSELNLLIQLAKVDKHFAEVEREMIMRVSKEKNFPEDQVEWLMQNPESIGTFGFLSPNQKFQYLMDCIELVLVDNKVMESELIFCRNVAIKMDFKKGVIDYLIQNHSSQPKEELRNVVFNEFVT